MNNLIKKVWSECYDFWSASKDNPMNYTEEQIAKDILWLESIEKARLEREEEEYYKEVISFAEMMEWEDEEEMDDFFGD